MVFEADQLISEAIQRHKDHIAVACSFGKDSIVVLHMALKYDPNIKVLFENTGVEFPETIAYKNMLVKKWGLNIIETKPIKSFWDCVKEYGLPGLRGKTKGHTPKCCLYCKEMPGLIAMRKHGINAILTGLLGSESRQRKLLIMRYDNKTDSEDNISFCGQRYYARSNNIWKYHPIAYWSEKQVWDYIADNQIDINPVYTKWGGIYNRCGCLPCTAYYSWEKRLSKSHHKLYLKLKSIADPNQKVLECQ